MTGSARKSLISVVAGKVLDKIKDPLMIKTLSKLG